jgi:hypothetical protein
MTGHDEQEMHHIDLALEVIDAKLARLEADKKRLLKRRRELSDKRHGGRLF